MKNNKNNNYTMYTENENKSDLIAGLFVSLVAFIQNITIYCGKYMNKNADL